MYFIGISEYFLEAPNIGWHKCEIVPRPLKNNRNYFDGPIAAVLTKSGKHIIVIEDWSCSEDIWIFDIDESDEYYLRKSGMKLPRRNDEEKISRSMVIGSGGMIDEIIVDGYMRRQKELYKFEIISEEMLEIIEMYFESEWLHIFQFDDENREHFMISIETVLYF